MEKENELGKRGRRGRIGRMLSRKMREECVWWEDKKGVEETGRAGG